MTGLLFLQSNDFKLIDGMKGPIMATQIKGISLVVFYSSKCVHCQKLLPVIKNLCNSIQGCQFGIVNVGNSKECILLSRNTKNPINVVPYVILYINGRPYIRYQGPHTQEDITQFIVEVTTSAAANYNSNENIQNRVTNSDKNNKQYIKHGSKIPAYCLGHPICGDGEDVCYLEFDGAYDNKN
jgi:thioredoxin-like negative regulator of GroEL